MQPRVRRGMSDRSDQELVTERPREALREPYPRGLEEHPLKFEFALPYGMYHDIYSFLFEDPSAEHVGVILAGMSRVGNTVKLLGREFMPARPEDCESEQLGGVRAKRDFSTMVMRRCAEQSLSQVDVHSHPFGASPQIAFSGIDDWHEAEMAEYIYQHLPSTWYGSLVMNQGYFDGRVWLGAQHGSQVGYKRIEAMTVAGFPYVREAPAGRGPHHQRIQANSGKLDDITSRQVLAFGEEGQQAIERCRVGIIGVGGLGSVLVEGLTRLGVRHFVIVDSDVAEVTNLNRVVGMSYEDAILKRPKVDISKRMITSINPAVDVETLQESLFSRRAVELLKTVDVLFVATDDHSSRMVAQGLGTQYLLPLISVGVHIAVGENGELRDVSGEVITCLPGERGFCLRCANRYNSVKAGLELMSGEDRARVRRRGYIEGDDTPSPAVRHLNGVVADLALAEFHNLLAPFKAPELWIEYDQLKTFVRGRPWSRDPSCPVCSPRARLGLGDLEPLERLFTYVQERDILNRIPQGLSAFWDQSVQDGASEQVEDQSIALGAADNNHPSPTQTSPVKSASEQKETKTVNEDRGLGGDATGA